MEKRFTNEKTPELYAAKRALIAYMKANNIDPSDSKLINSDPKLKELVYKLNKERDKVMRSYPSLDKSNNIKLLKMAKKEKTKKVKEVKEAQGKEEKKENKPPGRKTTKYDYPQVKDEKTGKMREMTSDEKKKYRVEQRKKASGKASTEKPSKAKKEEVTKTDKKKKAKKEEVTKTSKKKQGKKVKKEED